MIHTVQGYEYKDAKSIEKTIVVSAGSLAPRAFPSQPVCGESQKEKIEEICVVLQAVVTPD